MEAPRSVTERPEEGLSSAPGPEFVPRTIHSVADSEREPVGADPAAFRNLKKG